MRSEPHILELRIHGVNNTAPYDLLEVPEESVERSRGDSAGSFWTPTSDALDRARADLDAAGGEPVPADYVPPTVRREAYSWGPMARESGVPSWAAANTWVVRLSRAGWMLLIPFGLTNAAYWTRALRARDAQGRPQYGRGAKQVRLFGYGLTLLWVSAAETVACWLFATQCLSSRTECRELPTWLAGLSVLSWPQRMALGSLVPVALLLLLWWLSRGSSNRYEMPTQNHAPAASGAPAADAGAAADPTLADPRLWSRWALTRSWSFVHLAGGLALVTLFAAIAQGWSRDSECQTITTTVRNLTACLPVRGEAAGWVQLVLGVVALLVMLAAGWLAAVTTADDVRPGAGNVRARLIVALLVTSVAALVVELVALARDVTTVERSTLPGIDLIQGVLLVTLLIVAMGGLTWRGSARAVRTTGSVAWVLGASLVLVVVWPESIPALGAAGALAVAYGVICIVAAGRRRAEAWLGRGPGVMLLVALGVAVAGAGVVVVATGDWLNAGQSAAQLSPAVPDDPAATGARLLVPITYVESAVASVIALVVALVVIVGYLVLLLPRGRLIGEIDEPRPPDHAALVRALHDQGVLQPAGRLKELRERLDLRVLRRRTRTLAALSQRAIWMVGAVAVAMGVALTVTAILSVDDAMHADDGPALTLVDQPWFAPLAALGLWTNSLLFAALLIRVVTAPDQQKGRPIALTWDLMCVLPRGGHPLGPPCYAERAVPELAARIDAWLDGTDLPNGSSDAGRRRVVLGAHSLGCVLAVAAFFMCRSAGDAKGRARGRIALLTFGSQLRPYFGRILPEMLGPAALGNLPCSPGTTGPDPWAGADPPHRTGEPLPTPADGTLLERLTPAPGAAPLWVNLWRRTDFLGMPAYAYWPNPVDRPAEEIDATGYVPVIGTHSNYPRTAEYRHAMADLVARLGR
ncbi:hypothetical protein OEB99_13800 [Actinotalea sp. M2MS4P-6]|uniref:hypothetical protein n=1 Tax=Actinotalea sp. M2MS4P-6 TaxID=2983762 RepID=UPI0021E3699A|nr:hypothetical protein [Actinotalea sp. M2MS4P-6]MCV2395386.1 hypothetical protein [Actinotalea sp. M2MS4P-6]